ncbi:MAG: hypothetical protein R2932_07035 [Caldilineaceae bacterium]
MNNYPNYADLQIRILEPTTQSVYPVEITLNGALEFERGALSKSDLETWVPNAADPVATGKSLFQLLLGNNTVRNAWSQVQGMYPLRRVRLRVDFTAPELNAIPWEMMVDHTPSRNGAPMAEDDKAPIKLLAAAADTPFMRYQADDHPIADPLIERPIRMLVVIANPVNLPDFGLAPVDVEEEMAILHSATEHLDIHLTKRVNCTIQELEEELRKGTPHSPLRRPWRL